MRLSVAQLEPAKGEIQLNLIKHLRMAKMAADQGAGMILFPEIMATIGLVEAMETTS